MSPKLREGGSVHSDSSLGRLATPRSGKSCPEDATNLWHHECEKPEGGAVASVASRTHRRIRATKVGGNPAPEGEPRVEIAHTNPRDPPRAMGP